MSGILNKLGSVSGILGTTVAAGVPANLVAYRASSASTPTGFSEYTSVRGRMIVGMPSGGTDAGTVGSAFTNTQSVSFSIAHTHTVSNHVHKMGWNGSNSPHNQAFFFQHGGTHGNSGTFAAERYINATADHGAPAASNFTTSDPTSNPASGSMSANAAVATGDVLGYIQLMTIKKD